MGELAGGVAGASGDGGSGPVITGPGDLPGLVLWLDASHCLADQTSRVTECTDRSSNSNSATQSDPALRPLLVPHGIGSRPTLSFDGGSTGTNYNLSQLQVNDAESLRAGTGDFSVVVVARWHNSTEYISEPVPYGGYGGIFGKFEQTFPYRGIGLFANYPGAAPGLPTLRRFGGQVDVASFATSYSFGLNDDTFRILALRRIGDGLDLRINGLAQGGAQIDPTVDVSAPGQAIIIGGAYGTPLRGEVAELLFVRGPLLTAELEAVELLLKAKYGL